MEKITVNPTRSETEILLSELEENGFCILRGIIPDDEIERLQKTIYDQLPEDVQPLLCHLVEDTQ